MGISRGNGCRGLFNDAMVEIGKPMPELSIAELGSQNAKEYDEATGMRRIQAHSALCQWFGARCVTFDWNGKNRSVVLDLGKRIRGHKKRTRWMETFDIVTDFGTVEHVRNSQYWVFRNVHDLCKPGGLMIHTPPRAGTCIGHGYWSYTTEWFSWLAEKNNYEIIYLGEHDVHDSHPHRIVAKGHSIYVQAILRKQRTDTPYMKFMDGDKWRNPVLEEQLPRRRSKPVHPI